MAQRARISKISVDWVTKGFHLRVHGIELVMRPDHKGGIVLKKWFRSDSDRDADAGITIVQELLQDRGQRRRFYRAATRARDFLKHVSGVMESTARGKSVELTFVMAALRKLGI